MMIFTTTYMSQYLFSIRDGNCSWLQLIHQQYEGEYEEHVLAAEFIPTQFKVIGKNDGVVEISQANIWGEREVIHQIPSNEEANLELLFAQNPEAKTLYQWSPFVVAVEDIQ